MGASGSTGGGRLPNSVTLADEQQTALFQEYQARLQQQSTYQTTATATTATTAAGTSTLTQTSASINNNTFNPTILKQQQFNQQSRSRLNTHSTTAGKMIMSGHVNGANTRTLGDATARFQNQTNTRNTEPNQVDGTDKKVTAVQQQPQPLSARGPRPFTNSSRNNENAVNSDEYYPTTQVPTGPIGTNTATIAPRVRNGSALNGHRIRTNTFGMGINPKESSVKNVITVTELPTAPAPSSRVTTTFTRTTTLTVDFPYDPALQPCPPNTVPTMIPSNFASSENVHLDSTDVEEVMKGLETIDLSSSRGISLSDPIPEITLISSTTTSPIPITPDTSSSEPALPPPALDTEHILTFPQRNDTARKIPSHFILADELTDIRTHLQLKEKELAVHPNYLSLQPELNYRMREILADWLQGVSGRFRLKNEAIMLCMNLLDRFLSKRECSRDKFQLVGITCLILAAKYEEIVPPSIDAFIAVTDHAFEKAHVLHMEGVILESVGYELTIPYLTSFTGPLLLLCPIPSMDNTKLLNSAGEPRNFESELKNLTMYYCLASVQHYQFLAYPSSLVAAAAVALAYYQLQHDMNGGAESPRVYWDSEMQSISGGYELKDLIDCMHDFHDCLTGMSERLNTSSGPKYNSITKRFMRSPYDEVAMREIRLPNNMA